MTTAAKTEMLTARELAFKRTVPNYGPLQQAQIRCALRTGVRISSSVAKGRITVGVLAYALNRKGEPTGVGSMRDLRAFAVGDVAILAFIDGLTTEAMQAAPVAA